MPVRMKKMRQLEMEPFQFDEIELEGLQD